jgi:hypothetical protein
MEIQVLINPIADNRFQACGGPPFPFVAEGDSPYDAVQNLRKLIEDRLKAGATVCRIDVPAHESSWSQWAGMWKPDDPFIAEWQKAVEDYRRQMNCEANAL